jgi:hypothetical protein
MGKSYKDAMRTLSKKLVANGPSNFHHPTAKGDDREGLIQTLFQPRIGATFEAVKGEIVDCHGKTTGEMDLIIYDRSVGSCVDQGSRHLVRVESVAATVEIKSQLKLEHLAKAFKKGNKGLLQLLRYYDTTELRDVMGVLSKEGTEEVRTRFGSGINPFDCVDLIPGVPNFMLGYRGLKKVSPRPGPS